MHTVFCSMFWHVVCCLIQLNNVWFNVFAQIINVARESWIVDFASGAHVTTSMKHTVKHASPSRTASATFSAPVPPMHPWPPQQACSPSQWAAVTRAWPAAMPTCSATQKTTQHHALTLIASMIPNNYLRVMGAVFLVQNSH